MSNTSLSPTLFLYNKTYCRFCKVVLNFIKNENLDIETRNPANSRRDHEELIKYGGKSQVPCLKIVERDGSEHWLYESTKIIQYLQENQNKLCKAA